MVAYNKIIDIAVIVRWVVTVGLLYFASIVAGKYPKFIIILAIISSIFCEIYGYLWQRELRKNK